MNGAFARFSGAGELRKWAMGGIGVFTTLTSIQVGILFNSTPWPSSTAPSSFPYPPTLLTQLTTTKPHRSPTHILSLLSSPLLYSSILSCKYVQSMRNKLVHSSVQPRKLRQLRSTLWPFSTTHLPSVCNEKFIVVQEHTCHACSKRSHKPSSHATLSLTIH